MKKIKIIALLALILLFQACNETETELPAPQLQINVISKYLVPVADASVSLYATEDDWFLKQDTIATLQTDAAGKVLFESLEEQKYYFFVEKDGLDNTSDVAATKNALQIGQRFEVVTKLDQPIPLN
nr:hypothetical protein [uncultured Draconibacterium sp.]